MSKFGSLARGVKGLAYAAKSGVIKHSPEILMGVGTVGVITAGVMACVQTRKLDDVLNEHEDRLNRIKNLQTKSAELGEPQNYGKEAVMVYGSTSLRIARLYALPLTIGAASLICFFGAHKILNKRLLGLAAAYNALDTTFKQYRGRVTDRFGEEVERQIRHGIVSKEVEEIVVDENGEEKTVKKTVNVTEEGIAGAYVRYLTRHNRMWDRSPDVIKFRLLAEQRAANDKLKARARTNPHHVGMLTFNEVLEPMDFDIPDDGSGLVVGWIYDEKHPCGDNFVEFDVTPVMIPGENGKLEQAYAIDFNVDGNIFKELHDRDLARRELAS